MTDLEEQIKEFFQELREDAYNQYMLYPLDEIEKAALASVSAPQREGGPQQICGFCHAEFWTEDALVLHVRAQHGQPKWGQLTTEGRVPSQPDQFPDAGKMVDLSGKIAPEGGIPNLGTDQPNLGSGELVDRLMAEWRGVHYLDVIKEAARRIRELEAALEQAREKLKESNAAARRFAKDLGQNAIKIESLEAKLAEAQDSEKRYADLYMDRCEKWSELREKLEAAEEDAEERWPSPSQPEEGSGADADAEEDARRHPWAPDKPAPQPEGGSGELLKIAEQFRAMNPPWFKAISDAAIRIKELEAHNDDLIKKYETEIKELEADRDSWKNLAWIERDETALRIRELEAKLAEASEAANSYQDLFNSTAVEREALREKLAEANRTLQGFNYVSPHEADLREKLEGSIAAEGAAHEIIAELRDNLEAAETELLAEGFIFPLIRPIASLITSLAAKLQSAEAEVAKLREALEEIATGKYDGTNGTGRYTAAAALKEDGE